VLRLVLGLVWHVTRQSAHTFSPCARRESADSRPGVFVLADFIRRQDGTDRHLLSKYFSSSEWAPSRIYIQGITSATLRFPVPNHAKQFGNRQHGVQERATPVSKGRSPPENANNWDAGADLSAVSAR
jgi:hypothetical protein